MGRVGHALQARPAIEQRRDGSPVRWPPWPRCGRWRAITPTLLVYIARCSSLSREPASLTVFSCGLPRVLTPSPLSVKSRQPPEPDPLHWGSAVNYDDDVGGDWGAPGHANGVLMQDGNITAGFNALNQPMGIWVSGTAGVRPRSSSGLGLTRWGGA